MVSLKRPRGRGETVYTSLTLKPSRELPSVARLHRMARKLGRRAGRAAAAGNPQAERITELPGRISIEARVEARISQIKRIIHDRSVVLRHRIPSTQEQQDAEAARIKTSKGELERVLKAQKELPSDRSPSHVAYSCVLAVLALAEYPTLQSALQTFPADGFTRKALAVVLSCVLALSAHYLAKSIRAVVDEGQHPEQEGRRFERRLAKIQVIIFCVVIVGLMLAMGLSRDESFVIQANLTDGAFGKPGVLAGLLLALQLVLFVVAVVVGLLHAEGERRRQLRKQRRHLEGRIRKLEHRYSGLAAHRSHLEEELDSLAKSEQLWIEREHHLRDELLAGHDHAYESCEHSFITQLVVHLLRLKRA